jgi:CARDB protein
MRRSILIAACGAVALASALPGSALASAVKSPAVKLISCTPDEHSAVYQGRMATIPGADRMAMRYVLLSQVPGKAEARVRVPGLSRWRRSKPGVGAFAWRQELLNLAVGATYRVQVDFRWFDTSGDVVRSVRRRSVTCRQFSDLPNLRVQVMGVGVTTMEGVVRYRVRVDNSGAVTAFGAVVRLSVDGAVARTQTLTALAAGESRTVGLLGPPCGRWVEAAADPDNSIVEVSESDNTHSLACADLAPARSH